MAKKIVKKTGKSNLGPEMAKKAHEAKVSGLKPFNPDWDEKPQRQQTIFGDDKPYQVKKVKAKPKPGQTVVGPLSGRPARGGMGGGIGFPNSANQ